jgi:hypothetical protein
MSPIRASWRLVALGVIPCTLALLPFPRSPGVPGSVTPTAAMSQPRMAHTATTLPDGRVLVAGGFTNPTQAAHAAELYDPVTRRFLPLPPMITMRHSHTATLLPNGLVLIAGGYGADNVPVTAAELFDPALGRFAPTGAMLHARAGQVAVLLADGRVLLAGGVGPGWDFLSSAEVYDPATGRFSATGSMSVARESHVAVRLRDGRVLIAGGHRGRHEAITLYGSAEAYDPAAGIFRPVSSMSIRRHKHDAVLLASGEVLVTGGADERDNRGVYRSTELFDPRTGAFHPGPELRLPRYKHAGSSVLRPDGMALIAGGAGQAELYDPVRGSFAIVPGDGGLAGQFSAVALLADGGALITGGYGNGTGPRASAWVYHP